METCVMTSCSHNCKKEFCTFQWLKVKGIFHLLNSIFFSDCSLCIRKYLHYKTQCPACFADTFEKDLRKNKVLDDVIALFLKIKDKLKRCLQIQIQFIQNGKDNIILNSPKTISVDEIHLNKQEPKIPPKNIITKINASPSTTVQKDLSSPSTSGRTKIPLMFTPKSAKRLIIAHTEDTKVVICPVCKVAVSELHINKHLDDCLKRESMKDRPETLEPKRKQLPKLVFSLMKDVVLKKKLKEFGLSSQGDRRALETRLQRYIVLYNAECDRFNPRPVSELLKQCEDEENLEKRINKTSSFINKLQVNRNTEQNVIDDERKKYLETNKNSYENLIRQIKSSNSSKNPSVRRNLLNESIENNEQILQKTVAESSDESMNDNDKNRPANSNVYIQDSDSDTSCPLQMYSSTDPKKFLNIELSPAKNNASRSMKCEIVRIEKCDSNSDALSDISVTSREMPPIMDTTFQRSISETDSKRPSRSINYRMLLQRKEKSALKEETRSMNSVTSKEDSDSNNTSDQEEMEDKKSAVLQDIVHDLSSNDSVDSKFNGSM